MERTDKVYVIFVALLMTCWIQVICQSTLGNIDNRKCKDSTTEYRVLMNKLQNMEDKVNRMENYGKHYFCILLILTFTVSLSNLKFWNILSLLWLPLSAFGTMSANCLDVDNAIMETEKKKQIFLNMTA